MACNQWCNTRKRALFNTALDCLETEIPGNFEIESAQDNDILNSVSSQLCDIDVAEEGEIEYDESSDVSVSYSNLESDLSDWPVRFHGSLGALSALLSILRAYHPGLSKDGRSLL